MENNPLSLPNLSSGSSSGGSLSLPGLNTGGRDTPTEDTYIPDLNIEFEDDKYLDPGYLDDLAEPSVAPVERKLDLPPLTLSPPKRLVREESVNENFIGNEVVQDSPTSGRNPAKQSVTTDKQDVPKNDSETEVVEKNTIDASKEEFVDKKGFKIKPFGKTLKDKEVDSRRDIKKPATVVKWVVLAGIASIVGLGVYNIVFPNNSLDKGEVSSIALEAVGETGFPIERGAGFAKDFVETYLNVGRGATNNLGFYYTGNVSESLSENYSLNKGFTKKVIGTVSVYEKKSLLPYSASYTLGATVEVSGKDNSKPERRVEFYNVGVYWDSETDEMFITPESPTIVPPVNVGVRSSLPKQKALGDGKSDSELTNKVRPVVSGFLNAYSVSSPEDYSKILPFLVENAPVEMKTGLNGAYKFDGEPDNSIELSAYADGGNLVKVKARVKWSTNLIDPDGLGSSKGDYYSTYVITLRKVSGEKFLVEKIAPVYFQKAE